eukprot:GHVU01231088.1.p1 GENE.GHVU01231088.1~~GHVU01231088.1.p1  ORF type:complete len:296 (+),score=42.74 GHVU01231088.1:149-1036(+)
MSLTMTGDFGLEEQYSNLELWVEMSYIGAAIFFTFSLRGLRHPESAKMGNIHGIIGMLLAVFATYASRFVSGQAMWIFFVAAGPPAILAALTRPREQLLLVVGRVDRETHRTFIEHAAQLGVTLASLEHLPRISAAQSMDPLSSMAKLAGYRAMMEGFHRFAQLPSGDITAAGSFPPATVLVLGAGVAGLEAVSVAHRLGADVRGFDIRLECKEQVRVCVRACVCVCVCVCVCACVCACVHIRTHIHTANSEDQSELACSPMQPSSLRAAARRAGGSRCRWASDRHRIVIVYSAV